MWSFNINEEKKLLILKLSDTLTLDELSEFLKEIYDKNDGKYATYNRFTDLSDLKEIKVDFDAFSSCIHECRRKIAPDPLSKFHYLYLKTILGDFPIFTNQCLVMISLK